MVASHTLPASASQFIEADRAFELREVVGGHVCHHNAHVRGNNHKLVLCDALAYEGVSNEIECEQVSLEGAHPHLMSGKCGGVYIDLNGGGCGSVHVHVAYGSHFSHQFCTLFVELVVDIGSGNCHEGWLMIRAGHLEGNRAAVSRNNDAVKLGDNLHDVRQLRMRDDKRICYPSA